MTVSDPEAQILTPGPASLTSSSFLAVVTGRELYLPSLSQLTFRHLPTLFFAVIPQLIIEQMTSRQGIIAE